MAEHREGIRSRYELSMNTGLLNYIPLEGAMWHETEETKRLSFTRSQERARLMGFVRLWMATRLTKRERHCVESYYLEGMTLRELASLTSTHPTSVMRAIQRGITKLRAAAREEGVSWR